VHDLQPGTAFVPEHIAEVCWLMHTDEIDTSKRICRGLQFAHLAQFGFLEQYFGEQFKTGDLRNECVHKDLEDASVGIDLGRFKGWEFEGVELVEELEHGQGFGWQGRAPFGWFW
jgi:hypothetical protein